MKHVEEKQYIKIPVIALELLKAVGFISRYSELCQTAATFAEAYEQTEQEYEKHFRHRRYADYYSFKRSLSYHRHKKDDDNKNVNTDQMRLFGEP